jgi:hypothetical protein
MSSCAIPHVLGLTALQPRPWSWHKNLHQLLDLGLGIPVRNKKYKGVSNTLAAVSVFGKIHRLGSNKLRTVLLNSLPINPIPR